MRVRWGAERVMWGAVGVRWGRGGEHSYNLESDDRKKAPGR